MDGVTIIIAVIFVILIILLLVVTFVFKNNKKKSILNTIDRLTTEKNQIISASLITELSKASKLVNNNKKTEKDILDWKTRFENIEKVDLPKLTDKLVDAETFCINEDYVGAYNHLVKVEKSIFHVRAKAVKLLSEIKELTQSEERNDC